MTAMSPIGSRTPCVEFAALFQHRLVEDPAPASAPVEMRRRSLMMTRKAQHLCTQCPVMAQCLYDAVVRFDVAGYAGGATAKQRAEIRVRLGIRVAYENFGSMAGVAAGRRQVDHDEVLRLHNANPEASLETIAVRLGCSLSTVKRHMRQARMAAAVAERAAPEPLPEMAEVLTAYRAIVTDPDDRRPYLA
ncbi:WhiB family transcriptional regulator [Propionicicella superfundia]|uniref:WhiB family transcriptional regulator n=1 Tax=Propionicicella superfundia TaxID=348582 RepID=UPI0003FAA953|nr:WhiB family transcriptional regulator [Propionicicella superfundia]